MVYIHSDSERKLPHNFDAACALYGAIECAQDIRLTSLEEVVSGKFDNLIRKHLFVGSVDFMHAVFERVGVEAPALYSLLDSYLLTNLSVVRNKVADGESWFVKPVHAKLFTGMVFDLKSISQLSVHSGETLVLINRPFESSIVSETRCYIHRDKIVDARNYAADFRKMPDWKWVGETVNSLRNKPIAFTIDVAVLENGKSVVVELNDMWAIGNYGIDNSQYYTLLSDRYFQIVNPISVV
jgi:hypothetical protein